MIGDEFAGRLSGRPALPVADPGDGCPICSGPHGRCVGPDVTHVDTASMIRELAVARGQQQTRGAPGRTPADPAKESAAAAPDVIDPLAAPVTGPDPAAGPDPVAGPTPTVAASAPAQSPAVEVVAPAAPHDPSVQTLSPPDPVPDAAAAGAVPSSMFPDRPTIVRDGTGAYRTQGVDARAGTAPIPADDPTVVRDFYVVPAGVIDPVDDPHRPDPATSVLVSDANQLIATGAWMTLPGGSTIAVTRRVLRVWYPMGTLSPSYSTVADRGAVLPKPSVPVAAATPREGVA